MQMIRVLAPLVIDDILRRRGELVLVPDDWHDPATEVRKSPREMAELRAGKAERLEAARAEQATRRANAGQGQGNPGGGHGNAGNPPGQTKQQGSGA